ncbi:MAG TPA: hypothetical protein VKU38_18880 [Ktedonobacteraceae bacterium]|nr:hypothetical protein [Ktedonobacteraceae bacterium]
MFLQHNHHHVTTSHHALLQTFTRTHKITEPPELLLRVGSVLDPGIKRKDKPGEDSISVTHGLIATSSDLMQPFALFVDADGIGGQAYGEIASQLAVQSLVMRHHQLLNRVTVFMLNHPTYLRVWENCVCD